MGAIETMPENSIGELMFLDTLDLGALKLERESTSFRRRRRLQDSNSTNTTDGLTYMKLYTNQMFYWFSTACFIIIYVFSYCFAGMIYDDDKMLYTTFDANFDNKNN